MADYNDIKQSIATNLPDNNKREITASKLRDTLNKFVNKVETTETGLEQKCEVLNNIDDKPTAGSNNLVKSGGVQNELALGAVYDVSAKNPTAGPNNDGKWESLSALLSDANLSTLIPISYRKGGMSIKFIQSSNNIYVQYRLMTTSFTTNKSVWLNITDDNHYIDWENSKPFIFSSNFLLKAWIKNPGNYKYGISAIINNELYQNRIYMGRYPSDQPQADITDDIAQNCTINGKEYVFKFSGGAEVHIWVDWTNVGVMSTSFNNRTIKFSDLCYETDSIGIPDNFIGKDKVNEEIEITENKETGETLSDDITKYPSSHTVLQSLGNFASKSDVSDIKTYSKPVNEISGVGTQNIDSIFRNSDVVKNILDTDSPFKNLLGGYKSFLINSGFEREPSRRQGSLPTSIAVSFWVNEDEFLNWEDSYNHYFDLNIEAWNPSYSTPITLRFYVKKVLNQSIGTEWVFNGRTYIHAYVIGKWHQIIGYAPVAQMTPSDGWDLEISGRSMPNSISIVNPQVVFDVEDLDFGISILRDKLDKTLSYPITLDIVRQNIAEIEPFEGLLPEITENLPKTKDICKKVGLNPNNNWGNSDIAISKFDSSRWVVRAKGIGSNNDYVIYGDVIPTGMLYKIPKSSSDIISITSENRMISTDDTCPFFFDGTYQGGGHGWNFMRVVQMNPEQGLNETNIGQVWKDSNNKLFLVCDVNLIADNVVTLLGINSASVQEFPYFHSSTPSGAFEVINPENTGLTYQFSGLYSSVSQYKHIRISKANKSYIDDVLITDELLNDTNAYNSSSWICGSKYRIETEYSLVREDSFINYLIQNVGTLKNNFDLSPIDLAVTLTEIYHFRKGGAISLVSTVSSHNKVLNDFSWGQTQQGAGFGESSTPTEQCSIPNYSGYTSPVNTPTTFVKVTYENAIDDTKPLTRFYRFDNIQDSFTKGLVEGFCDIYGTGTITEKKAQPEIGRIETSKKWYPMATGSSPANLPKYSVITSIAYKAPLENVPFRPAVYWINDNLAYLILETYSADNSLIKLSENLIGWKITEETKFGDLSLHSNYVGKDGVYASSNGYGSGVYRLENIKNTLITQ